MENQRLNQLLKMEKSDLNDITLKYMIALEYKKLSDVTCEDYFFALKKEHPKYLATYYTAGEYFYEKEDYETSMEFLTQGLSVAQEQENKKTYDEIKNLLFNVEMEL